MAIRYHVSLLDSSATQVAIFDDFISLSFTRKLNNVGSFSITFADTMYTDASGHIQDRQALFGLDYFVQFYRSDSVASLTPYVEFTGMVRKIRSSITSSGERYFTVEGFCPNHLLTRRVVAYNGGTIRADKDDKADQVMYEYVLENCGVNAIPDYGRVCDPDYGAVVGDEVDADGVMQGFITSVPPPIPVGFPDVVKWSGSVPFENLLDVLMKIAEYANIDFNVRFSGQGGDGTAVFFFEVFNHWYGVDRTYYSPINPDGTNGWGYPPTVFAVDFANVQDIERNYDRTQEATVVFVLGRGDASTRSVLPVRSDPRINASPWNKIEIARSASNQEFVYQLRSEGIAELTAADVVDEISLTVLPQYGTNYAKDFFLGDHVVVSFRGIQFDYRIVAITIDYSGEGEETIKVDFVKRKVFLPGTTLEAA